MDEFQAEERSLCIIAIRIFGEYAAYRHGLPSDDLFPNKQRGLHGKFQGVKFRRTRAVSTDESTGKYTSSIVIGEACVNRESLSMP
jgi:hypothetical protein